VIKHTLTVTDVAINSIKEQQGRLPIVERGEEKRGEEGE